jgi:hypothetical protein
MTDRTDPTALDARAAAALYLGFGAAPVPVHFRSKKPALAGWQRLRPSAADLDHLFPSGKGLNVGLLLGAPSAGLIDVDLDAAAAVAAGAELLPATGWVSGRASKPRSHWWYRVADPPACAQDKYADLDGTDLLELRSTGGQTVVPPGVHPSGEPLVWDQFGRPEMVELAEIVAAVQAVAAAALLARHWPAKGSRHDARLALAGALARAGWAEPRITPFVRAVTVAAGNRGLDDAGCVAGSTLCRQAGGQNTWGWPKLEELLGGDGPAVVERVRRWLVGAACRAAPPSCHAAAGALSCSRSGDTSDEAAPRTLTSSATGAVPGASGPARQAGPTHTADWPDPVPLGTPPEAPPFPLDVLPGPLHDFVAEAARALHCPADLVAVPLLVLAGGAAGNARHLALTASHVQAPCLYAVVIGRPGTAKSPALKLLRGPFDSAQQGYLEDWRAQHAAWEESEPAARGPRPVPRRCLLSDATTESLGPILSGNPRGVVMIRDELTGLVTGMNQYKAGRGHDRQVYLALWAGDALLVDRKSDRDRQGGPLHVEGPFLAIVGGTQPGLLAQWRGSSRHGPPADDGFLDRFLIVHPAELPAAGEQWLEVSPAALAAWQGVVAKLLALEMSQEGDRPRPVLVGLTECGRRAWEEFTHAHAAEVNGDLPPHLHGAWAKLRGYAARLGLIVHLLRQVCGEAVATEVDGDSLRRAARLVAYFKGHRLKVDAALDADPRTADARRVLGWLCERRLRRFSRRDVHVGLRRTFRSVDELAAVLTVLEKHGLIRQEAPAERPGPGRKPSPVYEVHPSVLEECPQNPHNPQNSPAGGALDSVDCVDSVRASGGGQ